MIRNFRIVQLGLCVSLAIAGASCGGGDSTGPRSPSGGGNGGGGVTPTPNPAKAGITIIKGRDTLNAIRQKTRWTATGIDAQGNVIPPETIKWGSLDPTVANLAGDTIIAVAPGTARIVAYVGQVALADTETVVVRQIFASIKLTWTADTLFAGDTITLPVTGRDSNDFEMPLPENPVFASNVATISHTGNGVFRAETTGLGTLSATVRGVTRNATVYVEEPFKMVRTGGGVSCGMVLRGAVYCWGLNTGGLVGVANTGVVQARPLMLKGVPAFKDFDVGSYQACALANDGTPWCWGNGLYWSAGDLPKALTVPEPFTTITVGNEFACGTSVTNKVYCWGRNDNGQIDPATQSPGAKVTVPTLFKRQDLTSIRAGNFRGCGLNASSNLICWGAMLSDFQVMDGTRVFREIEVGGPICGVRTDNSMYCTGVTLKGVNESMSGLAVGGGHSCAIGSGSFAWCWGENNWGQLGNGGRTLSETPSPVAGNILFTQLTAWENTTCGLTPAGAIYCWGQNLNGQLGPGGNTTQCFNGPDCSIRPHRVGRLRYSATQAF